MVERTDWNGEEESERRNEQPEAVKLKLAFSTLSKAENLRLNKLYARIQLIPKLGDLQPSEWTEWRQLQQFITTRRNKQEKNGKNHKNGQP